MKLSIHSELSFQRLFGHILMISLFIIATSLYTFADDEYLNIGFLGDVSGPIGFWNAPRLVGIQDAIEYVNNEMGGVRGKKLKLDWRDQKSDAGLHLKYYNEMKANTYLIMHTCGTGEQQMAKPFYERDKSKIFLTCSMSPGVLYPVGHVFGTGLYYPDQFGAFFDWVAENWNYQKEKRNPRVAFMTYNNAIGRVCLEPEVLAYAEKRRVDIVDTIFIPFITIDPLTPLLQAKEAGADWLAGMYLWQTLPPYLKANKEYKLGLKFFVSNMAVDDVIVSDSGEAAEGLTGVTSWTLTSEVTTGMEIINRTIKKKNRKSEDRGISYILGWMNIMQTKLALEETLTRVKSWDKVTVPEIMLTLESWTDKDILGLAKFTYSPTHRGPSKARMVQVENGQWKVIKDWFSATSLVPEEWKKPIH